jgi:hypothetical protein
VPALLLLCALLTATPANANTIVRKDGNDTKGPLDLARLRISDAGHRETEFQLTTFSAFTNTQVNGKRGAFELDIDTDANRKADYFAVVVAAAGKMRGVLFDDRSSVVTRKLVAGRDSKRSVWVRIPLAKMGRPSSFDVGAFSLFFYSPCSSKAPCVDAIPNRYPLIRYDFTAPEFNWDDVPYVARSRPFPVRFTVKDDRYGSGIDRWIVQRRLVGTSGWHNAASGRTLSPKVFIDVPGGGQYEVRVLVFDRQSNTTVSSTDTTIVPWDDSDGPMVYSGSWSAASGVTAAFASTTHTGQQDATLDAVLPAGSSLCLFGQPTSSGTTASASISIPGAVLSDTVYENDATTAKHPLACWPVSDAGSSVELQLTVTSTEPFIVDAVLSYP